MEGFSSLLLQATTPDSCQQTPPVGVAAFVKKPFEPARLLKLIAETIDPAA